MATVYVFHSHTINLVKDEDPENERSKEGEVIYQGQKYTSMGLVPVNSNDDADPMRHKVAMVTPDGYSTIEVSPDFKSTQKEFSHLAEAVLDRHAPEESIVGLHSPDDEALGRRLAAVMGVAYLDQPQGE